MNEWRDDCSCPPHGQKCRSQDTWQRRDSTRMTNTLPLSRIHSLLFPFCVETESKLFRMALTSLCSTGRSWSSNPSSASPGMPPAQADTNLSPVIPIIPSVVSRDQHSNPDGQVGFAMCFRTAAHLWLSQCLSGLTSSPQPLLQHGAHPHNLRFSSQIIWWFFLLHFFQLNGDPFTSNPSQKSSLFWRQKSKIGQYVSLSLKPCSVCRWILLILAGPAAVWMTTVGLRRHLRNIYK